MYHIFFIQVHTDGHLGYFHILAIQCNITRSHKKLNLIIWDNMDETTRYYAKCNKSKTFTYMWISLKCGIKKNKQNRNRQKHTENKLMLLDGRRVKGEGIKK